MVIRKKATTEGRDLAVGGGLGVSAAVIIIYVAEMFLPEPIPGEVAAALGGLLSPVIAWIYSKVPSD